jgi:hypothetical protein
MFLYEEVKKKLSELDAKNKSNEEKIYQIDKYVFYLAIIGKYTYGIFHTNKDLRDKAINKLNDPDKFFSTHNNDEDEYRKETYAFFDSFRINEFKLDMINCQSFLNDKIPKFSIHNIKRISLVLKNDRKLLNELFIKNNEILHDLLNIRVDESLIYSKFFVLSIINKILLFHPVLCLKNMFVNIGFISNYEDIFRLLDKKRNEILLFNEKISNVIIEKKKIEIFNIYPQFKKDYGFFIKEKEDVKPYIVETNYHLIWTSDDGILAKYFKLIVPEGCDFKCVIIEKIFQIENIKQKSMKENKKWNEFNEKLTTYRKLNVYRS